MSEADQKALEFAKKQLAKLDPVKPVEKEVKPEKSEKAAAEKPAAKK